MSDAQSMSMVLIVVAAYNQALFAGSLIEIFRFFLSFEIQCTSGGALTLDNQHIFIFKIFQDFSFYLTVNFAQIKLLLLF